MLTIAFSLLTFQLQEVKETIMAKGPGPEFQEKLSEVTKCSICAEIFTNPKLLPCAHTFCLRCLENYGEDKNPGDQLRRPLCKNEFAIPQQDFSNLPNDFVIGKIVEIGKLDTVPAKEEVCELCFEETAVAKMVCIDCEQKLCDRCSKSHTRIKLCQNHQVVELGNQLNAQELNLRNSYCEHHPKELVKMFCHEDNVAICLICCVESHQSHRCSNVDKAAGQFVEQLKDDLRKVGSPADICRASSQMNTRTSDLDKQAVNCGVDDFYWDKIAFHSASLETFMQQDVSKNVVGELRVTKSEDRIVGFQKILVSRPYGSARFVEICVPMELGEVDLITKYMKDELQKIDEDINEYSGSIDTSKDKPGFIIRGNETEAGKAEEDLLKLNDSVIIYDHDIDRPGIPAYFYSWRGKEILRSIQINHKVSIQLDSTQSRPKSQAVAGDGSEKCQVEVRPGKFIILMQGDITKCNVDAIVNSSNEELKHIGRIAASIAEAAGPELEEDCRTHTILKERLLPGQACVTKAGKLPCKKVIHAVGPRWSGGRADEENILAIAVKSSLNAADEEGLNSIAMPLISTGLFGFPLDLATDIVVDAVENYFVDNSSTTVREVFFIDNDSGAVATLEKKLKTIEIERSETRRGRSVVSQHFRPSQNQDPLPNTRQRGHSSGAMQGTRSIADPRQQSQKQRGERQPQHLSRIILSIYALSRKAIDEVLKDIEEVVKDYAIRQSPR